MSGRVRVSFVIPVRNDARGLQRCLESLAHEPASRQIVTETIVIDNGSVDDSPSVARRAGATVLQLPRLKVAELRNRGVAAATGALLAFVDADHELGAEWLAAAAEIELEGDIGAIGARYSPPPAGSWVQRMYGAIRGRTVGRHDVDWLGSGNLVVRREAFDDVQGFDTELETCEDVEFCNRLRAHGWRIVADDRMYSVHYGDPATLRQLFRSELWRGRDNLRVTLRGPLTLRSLPSLVMPMVTLLGLGAIIIGVALWPAGQRWLAVAGALLVGAVALLRVVKVLGGLQPRRIGDLAPACAVALVYESARALALIFRTPHRRR
jgi:glycosyltransferase involved in cell wall biosynthesis